MGAQNLVNGRLQLPRLVVSVAEAGMDSHGMKKDTNGGGNGTNLTYGPVAEEAGKFFIRSRGVPPRARPRARS